MALPMMGALYRGFNVNPDTIPHDHANWRVLDVAARHVYVDGDRRAFGGAIRRVLIEAIERPDHDAIGRPYTDRDRRADDLAIEWSDIDPVGGAQHDTIGCAECRRRG